MRPQLRIFTGEEQAFTPPTISISFGELRKIIEEANFAQRTWMRDFAHDDVQIPEDLYEVLVEYSRLRPGA